ncbi:MAG: TIGR02281 family clan AA aspartic protease [Gammaproteobacteria bacterium]|jgi:aspartyl protease family protein
MAVDPHTADHNQTKRFGVWMVIGMWIIVLWLLTGFFSKLYEHEHNPNRNIATMVTDGGVREVVLQRNRKGHYVSSGDINGQPVTFMLDTGASDISIPARVASRLGLKKGAPLYFNTANGTVIGYSTVLNSVSIGDIALNNVRASINPNVSDMDILLGMSFLKHLEFTQRGDTLTLRQYPPSAAGDSPS